MAAGVNTPDNYLFSIIETDNHHVVTHVWVKVEDNIGTKSAFIYDIEIHKVYRRKGYAKLVLHQIEQVVANLGVSNLGLHVFKRNSGAIALYSSLGYQTVSYNIQKPIKVLNT